MVEFVFATSGNEVIGNFKGGRKVGFYIGKVRQREPSLFHKSLELRASAQL